MIDRKKHSYFKQIAGRRVERILEGLEALGNCSSPATYDYDNQELPPIFAAITEKLAETRQRLITHSPYNGCQRHFKMSFFAEMECRFLLDGIHVLCSLIHQPTRRLEACQALIYQLVLGLTGKNGKYNYPKAVHLYPPFFDIFCSAKNYKIAPALTMESRSGCSRPIW